MRSGGSGSETFEPRKLPEIVQKYYKRRWEMKGKDEDGYLFAAVTKLNGKWTWFYDDNYVNAA